MAQAAGHAGLRPRGPDRASGRVTPAATRSVITVTIEDDDAPGAPTGLMISAADARLDLSWTAPSDDGGAALAGYDVHYTSAPKTGGSAVADDAAVQTGGSASAADGWVAHPTRSATDTSTSQAITGLDHDASYRVRVRAKNAAAANGAPDYVPGSSAQE